jgi:hypothetical protein
MARRVDADGRLAQRLREVRGEPYGEEGVPTLAAVLGLPARTWTNYEAGVTLPAQVVLALLEATGVRPHWLLSGVGPMFRDAATFVGRN